MSARFAESRAAARLGAALVVTTLACAPAPERPNVLLVTIDTLRADRLGVYGSPGESSPELDRLATGAVVFERAISGSSRTAPSHASLFSSRWVRDHSIGYTNGATRLGDEVTLAGLLSEAGYDSAAFVSNAMLDRRLGLNSGFETYDDALPDSEANRVMFERIAEKTTRSAVEWIAQERSRPFFAWVQYNDPHGPYTPPEGYARAPEQSDEPPLRALAEEHGEGGIPSYQVLGDERDPAAYRALYAGEIRYFDEWLGGLLRSVEENGRGRETIIVLTADHGESLGEDGVWFAHGAATTPNLVHVPLLLRAPGVEPSRVSSLVHHVDVVPTLLDLLRLPPLPGAAGVSLVPLVRDREPLPERTLYADTGNDVCAYRGALFARNTLVEEDGEVVWRMTGHRWEPDGSWSAVSVPEALASEARSYADRRVPQIRAPRPTRDAKARLRALGYLD